MTFDDFINTVEIFPKSSCQTLVKQNLTQSEWEGGGGGGGGVKSLKEDNSIIINEAVKGGASVIMNKKDY